MVPPPEEDFELRVPKLFPQFQPNKVLRFSELFGPGKYSNRPRSWEKAKLRRQRREQKAKEDLLVKLADAAIDKQLNQNNEESDAAVAAEMTEQPLSQSQASSHSLESRSRKRKLEDHGGHSGCNTPGNDGLESCYATDEEEIYCRPSQAKSKDVEQLKQEQFERKLWRHGPAEVWYDMMGVPEDAEDFEYGFGLKATKEEPKEHKDTGANSDSDTELISSPAVPAKTGFNDECFNMVTQLEWEKDVIWDSSDVELGATVSKSGGWAHILAKKNSASSNTTKSFSTSTSTHPTSSSAPSSSKEEGNEVDETVYSMLPVDTPELVSGAWVNDIIWDVDAMDKLPRPKVLEMDPNDDNLVICIPDDVDPNAQPIPVKVNIPHPHRKKSKIPLGNAGVIKVMESDSPPSSPKKNEKDPYNISQDECYQFKTDEQVVSKTASASLTLQHSIPVLELRSPLVPTQLNLTQLRNFHRPPLRKYTNGRLSTPGPHSVFSLRKRIRRKARVINAERKAAGIGSIFFMKTIEDLSAKDGDIVLVEYSEEYPPMLNLPGMCSTIKNYFKRNPSHDDGPASVPLGELVIFHSSPFLGGMFNGQMIQTLENNMYRAPIYDHKTCNDFLVIRDRLGYYIRPIEFLFTAGQQCPLYEVPGPNSKRANNFLRDLLQVFIYRLFWQCDETPKRIRMDDVKSAFPSHGETSIRRTLKLCADFHRTGVYSNWWVLKSDFRLPTEDELREIVTPEQCCAHISLLTAEQRLKDAGYGAQVIEGVGAIDTEYDDKKLEDEVKTAPWNTTRAYIQAVKGKCIMQIDGPADPTGCGEGFSYVRMPYKPQPPAEPKEKDPKKFVTGTDGDLRRISLSNAKKILRQYRVPEEEIESLSRWEIIDVIRTLSTEAGQTENEVITKFYRANRLSQVEYRARYREECQRIFELQNRVLYSTEVLSTDEDESSEEETNAEEFEEMGKSIESILSNKRTTAELNYEREEAERLELQKMIMESDQKKDESTASHSKDEEQKKIDEKNNHLAGLSSHPNRILKILRTYKDEQGNEFTRTEIVRRPNIIDIYVRIRTTKDDRFIEKFTFKDKLSLNRIKQEKRRQQEKLKRIESGVPRVKRTKTVKETKKPKKLKMKTKLKPGLKVKCGACGNIGHMKTNKSCPHYEKDEDEDDEEEEEEPSLNVAMTVEEEAEMQMELAVNETDNLVRVDGTKLKLSRKLIQHARRSLLLKVPRNLLIANRLKARKKRQGAVAEAHCNYLEGKPRTSTRRRINPIVFMSNIFEDILHETMRIPECSPFAFPVSAKMPYYYDVILNPIDLQTMREKNRNNEYKSGGEFLSDLQLMADNCRLFNGLNNDYTTKVEIVFEFAKAKLDENAVKLSELEDQLKASS